MKVESYRMGTLERNLGGICCMGFEDSFVVAVDFLGIVEVVPSAKHKGALRFGQDCVKIP